MRPLIAATFALLAVVPAAGRAEDPPPATRQAAPPSWKERVIGDLAVSRDGAWLGGCTAPGWRLYPAAGGEPVTLDVPTGGVPSFVGGFTPDSKWFVVLGRATSGGTAKSGTQTAYVFSVAAPGKPTILTISLKAERASSTVPASPSPSLLGTIVRVVPFAGSCVLFASESGGADLWDVAAPSRLAAPHSLDGIQTFGISDDGATIVRQTDKAIEFRDVKSNRVVRAIAMPVILKLVPLVHDLRFATGGTEVVATFDWVDMSGGRVDVGEELLACWSVEDGKKRWSVPLGKAKSVSLDVAGSWATVVANDMLRIFDVRDGSLAVHRLQATKCRCAKVSADGKALWVADDERISRVELPAPPAK